MRPIIDLLEFTRPDYLDDAEKELFAAGYESLGVGNRGNVYAKPGEPWVLKLFIDEPYFDFVNYAIASGDAHFPVFKGKPVEVTGNYWAVRMERLAPLPKRNESLAWSLGDIAVERLDGSNETADEMREYGDEELNHLIDVVQDMADNLVKGSRWGFDIRPSNLMMRGDTIVITDPLEW